MKCVAYHDLVDAVGEHDGYVHGIVELIAHMVEVVEVLVLECINHEAHGVDGAGVEKTLVEDVQLQVICTCSIQFLVHLLNVMVVDVADGVHNGSVGVREIVLVLAILHLVVVDCLDHFIKFLLDELNDLVVHLLGHGSTSQHLLQGNEVVVALKREYYFL